MGFDFDAVVIGAGFSGLSAAYELVKSGFRPLVVEADGRGDGMAACHETGGFKVERLYHHFFSHDYAVVALIRELKLDGSLIWGKTHKGFYVGKRLYPFTTPLDLLCFGHIPFIDRLRFGAFIERSKNGRGDSGVDLDFVSSAKWIGDRVSSKAFMKVASLLLEAKFGVHMEEISAAFLKGRLTARADSRSALSGSERFGYLRGGLDALADALVERIRAGGGKALFGAPVEAVEPLSGGGFAVGFRGGRARARAGARKAFGPGRREVAVFSLRLQGRGLPRHRAKTAARQILLDERSR